MQKVVCHLLHEVFWQPLQYTMLGMPHSTVASSLLFLQCVLPLSCNKVFLYISYVQFVVCVQCCSLV